MRQLSFFNLIWLEYYASKADLMDLRLCGDGRILLQKSGYELNSWMSVDVRRLCSVVQRP
jgi:hypothetical protein